VLARKTAAQYQDNRRAFVTTNGCFPSKATKIPSLSWRRDDRFSAQNGKDFYQILGLLGHGREEQRRTKSRCKKVAIKSNTYFVE
jgi:hypothetical protein